MTVVAGAVRGGLPLPARLLSLVLLAFVIYGPSLRGDWVFDDHPAIVAREDLADLGGRAADALAGRRTLTDFTFALNVASGGLEPFGFHAVNVALHGANGALVFLFGAALFRRLGSPERATGAAWAAALLFVTHPLLSQAVAYNAQRYTSLATFFYLLAAWLYLRGRERGEPWFIAAAFVSGYLAMRSKEIAFTLPFALVLLELALYRGRERRLRFALPFLLLLPVIPAALFRGIEGVSRNLPAERLRGFREAPDLGRTEYLATELGVVLRYLRLIVWPSGLTVDHDVRVVPSLLRAGALAPLAGILLLAGGAWRLARRFPIAAGGLGWFFLTLAVESSVVPIRDVMVEHRAYLPSVGVFLVAGDLFARAGRRGTIALALVVLLLGTITFGRSRVWSNPVSLWTDAARKAPALVRPEINLGLAYRTAGRFADAEEAYRRAIAKNAGLVESWYGLAVSLDGRGKADEALAAFEKAIAQAPDYGPAYDGAADLLARMGRAADADSLLRLGLARAGESPARLVTLGDRLLVEGDPAGAERAYRRALGFAPDFEPAVIGLARALHGSGRSDEAERMLLAAAERRESSHYWNGIGVIRLEGGRRNEAADAFRRALRIDPNLAEARANLERLERRRGAR